MGKELLILGLVGVLELVARPSRAQSVELTMDILTSSVLSQVTTLLNNNAIMSACHNLEAEKRGSSAASAKRSVSTHPRLPCASKPCKTRRTNFKPKTRALARPSSTLSGRAKRITTNCLVRWCNSRA